MFKSVTRFKIFGTFGRDKEGIHLSFVHGKAEEQKESPPPS